MARFEEAEKRIFNVKLESNLKVILIFKVLK